MLIFLREYCDSGKSAPIEKIADGDVYEGDFKNDKMEGKYTYTDGGVYAGD